MTSDMGLFFVHCHQTKKFFEVLTITKICCYFLGLIQLLLLSQDGVKEDEPKKDVDLKCSEPPV